MRDVANLGSRETHNIAEGILTLIRLRYQGICPAVREQHGHHGFVGNDTNQTTTKHDGIANRKHLQVSGQQNAAVEIHLAFEIARYFEILNDGVNHFFEFALGRRQASAFKQVDDIVFRFPLPFALSFERLRSCCDASSFRRALDIKQVTANFAQELPAYPFELVMTSVKLSSVDKYHLQKTCRIVAPHPIALLFAFQQGANSQALQFQSGNLVLN